MSSASPWFNRSLWDFLTLFTQGQPQPLVFTLNAFDGAITPNMAIVPAGMNGGIRVYASDLTHVIIDVNGYFAPWSGCFQSSITALFMPSALRA